MSPPLFYIVSLLALHMAHAQLSANMSILLTKVFATDNPTMFSQPNQLCGVGRECVPRHLCVDGDVNKDGEDIITFRIGDDVECPLFQQCCSIDNQQKPAPLTRIGTKSADQRNHCGQRNENGVLYIISELESIESQFGEFPWMVALLIKNDTYHLIGGGSIIAPNIVLTAAHSVNQPDLEQQLIVRAGDWDLQSTDEAWPHQERRVSQIIQHERFNAANGHNDIALLLLDSPLDFTQPNVAPVCLPKANERSFDYTRCFATGWGKDRYGRKGRYRHTLKRVDVPIVTNRVCQRLLRDTVLGAHFELHESLMCAGGEKDKDTCQGDGGSPLVCPTETNPQHYQQLGIVSWGLRCGEENVPAAYANVRYLRQWLDAKLGSLAIDSTYYTLPSPKVDLRSLVVDSRDMQKTR